MNPRVSALVAKDLMLYFRNRFYAVITVLALVFFIAIYFLMPSSVDEELDIGLHAPELPPVFGLIQQQEGFKITNFENEEALENAVNGGQFNAGISLPADIVEKLSLGLKPMITLYFPSTAPEEIKDSITVLIKELAYLQTEQAAAIDIDIEVLGPDLLGDQIPVRDRMRPMLAIMIIMFEIMGLASLISEEVEQGTARALLVTPMRVTEFFTAKAIMGVGLAFVQAIVIMGIIGGLSSQPLIMLTTLFLGGILVTGIGFLVASVAKNMMSVMAWGVLAIILLIMPALGVLFPGTISGWIQVLPSYYLVDSITQVSNYGSGWGDVGDNLLILAGFNIVILWGGIMLLRRKFR